MSRARLLLVAVVSVSALSASSALAAPGDCRLIRGEATPDDDTDDVSVCREDVWFHQAETKAGNLGATGETAFPSWDTTPPSTSVTGGAGGGYVGEALGDWQVEEFFEETTATFDGTFTGDLENAAVTLYLFAPAYNLPDAGSEYLMRTQLVVDGVQLYASHFIEGDAVAIRSGGQAVLRIDFAITGLYDAMEINDLEGAEREHELRLSVSPLNPVTDDAVYVYDTTEVPSGIVFNAEPDALESYTEIEA